MVCCTIVLSELELKSSKYTIHKVIWKVFALFICDLLYNVYVFAAAGVYCGVYVCSLSRTTSFMTSWNLLELQTSLLMWTSRLWPKLLLKKVCPLPKHFTHYLFIVYLDAGCCGPITQNEFLHKMGIRPRLEVTPYLMYSLVCIFFFFFAILLDPNEVSHTLSSQGLCQWLRDVD